VIAGRELKRAPRRLARTWRAAIANLLAIAFVVVFVPFLIGLSFLDAFVIIPYACLSVFLVAILTAYSFAGDEAQREILALRAEGAPDRTILFGRVASVVLASWWFGLVMLAASLASMNWMNWHGEFLLPSSPILIAAAVLSGAATLTTHIWSVTCHNRTSPQL